MLSTHRVFLRILENLKEITMAATKDDIRQWLQSGKAQNATHVIVVCDTFDYEDYPVFVSPNENAQSKAREYGTTGHNGLPTLANMSMQRVMEVYSLSHDLESQLNEYRAFHFD